MSVHVANDPFQAVSVHYVRDSGVVSVEVLDSQLPKYWTLCQQMGDIVILRLTELAEVLYRAVKFAKMLVETSMASHILSGRMKVPLIGEGFMVQAILSIMGSQSLLHLGALSVRLSEGQGLSF